MQTLNNPLRPFLVVAVSSLMFFYAFALVSIFNVLQPHLSSALHISSTTLGLISSVSFYVEVLLLFPAGPILDSYSVKRTLLIALFFSITGVFLTASAHSSSTLLIARILMAVAAPFGFAGTVKLAVNWLPKKYLTQGIAFVATMGFVGGLIVQAPLTYAMAQLGWRFSLCSVGFVGIFIWALIYLFANNRPNQSNIAPNKQHDDTLSLLDKFKLAFFNKQNLLCGAYASLINIPVFMLGAMWGIAYLMNVNHMSELAASSICTMIFLGTIVGCPFIGFIADRFSCRLFLMKISAIISFMLAIEIIFFHNQSFTLLLLIYFALGFFSSTQMLSYPIVVERNKRAISSSATAVVSMLLMLGGAVSQPLFGYIIHQSAHDSPMQVLYGYQLAMMILLGAFAIALISSFLIQDTHSAKIP